MKDNKIRGIKAISFDGDNTLWDFDKVMRHSLKYVLEELGRLDPDAKKLLSVKKIVEIKNKVAEELKGKVIKLGEVRLEAFRRTLRDIGRPNDSLASHLNRVYYKHRFEDVELFDDVLPTFNTLKEKYKLGLLSNGNTYPKHCGLEGMFQFVVFSQDHGVEKPNSKIFQIALLEAGCSKEEVLHVGDSLNDDIAGAINAGIKCVWLNRNQEKNDMGIKTDYEITSLSELSEIISR